MKKFLAIILSCCVFFSTTVYAYAEENSSEEVSENVQSSASSESYEQITPVVIVPGLGASPVYLNPNTDEQESVIKFDSSLLKLLWKSHIVRTTLSVCRGANVDVDKYLDKLQMVIEPFKAMACDENGDSIENVGIDCYWTDSMANHPDHYDEDSIAEAAVCEGICDNIGAENVYLFNYDFRLDLVDYATDLSEYIDNVKSETGSDKVTIVCASLGTSIVSAYIDMYKDKNDVKRIVFLNGAFQGVSVTKLYSEDIYLNLDVVYDFIDALADSFKGSGMNFSTLSKWLHRFDKTMNHIVDFFQEMTSEEYIDRLYTDVLLPIVGNMPSLWECIAYDDFDDCVEAMVSIGWLSEDSGLYAKLQRYHEIQGRLEDNIKELEDAGVEIAIVTGYGFPGMPVTDEYNNNSDMLIDTKYEACGAIVADFGQQLSDDNMDEKYLSADGEIYAGTCVLPDSTWFIKYAQHMQYAYGTTADEFVCNLVTTSSALDIDSIEEETGIGQFSELDDDLNIMNLQ